MTTATSPNPVRELVVSWLERNGWRERVGEAFDELAEDVAVLLRDVVEDTEKGKADAVVSAAVAALGRATRTCEAFAKGVMAEASAATDVSTADRFRAMARAHERDARSIGDLVKAITKPVGKKR